MRPIVPPSEIARLDLLTMKNQALSSFELMKKVSLACAESLIHDLEVWKHGLIQVVCGPGNNGGDGYCIAQYLKQAGCSVEILAALPPKSKDCKNAKRFCSVVPSKSLNPSASVIIDAVFGNQSRAPLTGVLPGLFEQIKKSKAMKIAIDVPTGMCANTGACDRLAFRADYTLCIAFPKTGFLKAVSMDHLGFVEFIDVGFERPQKAEGVVIEANDFALEKRRPSAYKKSRCIVLAGSLHSPGAAFMSAEAAGRSGCGYVSLALAQPDSQIAIGLKEASFQYLPRWSVNQINQADCLVIGPGGAPHDLSFLAEVNIPVVVDGDGLTSQLETIPPKSPQILTPHPLEAGRLLGCSREEVLRDPRQAAEEISKRYRRAVYLKSSPCFLVGIGLCELDFLNILKCYVNMSSQPAFATAGSGDVLSGLLGGMIAQCGFSEGVKNAIAFHIALGRVLRNHRGSIASDQPLLFDRVFKNLYA